MQGTVSGSSAGGEQPKFCTLTAGRHVQPWQWAVGLLLALTAYRLEEKDKAQGALNFCVFAVLALSSLSSGVLVTTQGWQLLNLGSLLPLALTGVALGWLALSQRRPQNS